MNVLFLSLINVEDINSSGIYSDLLREFQKHGHNLYVVSPSERRLKQRTSIRYKDNVCYLNVWTFNYQKTSIVEKGISILLIEYQFKCAIKKYFTNVKFDLILYPTPPITFATVVQYVKQRDNAYAYLLLKDIFPQNAVDINLMSKDSIMCRYFRRKEKHLYEVSDTIGCMSPANVKYVLSHNPQIDPDKVEVCPNSIEIKEYKSILPEERNQIRESYGIPLDRFIYIYGGNLGKPQDIPFIIECLRAESSNQDIFFTIVGSGTEFNLLDRYIKTENPENAKLISHISSSEFDKLVRSCDAGLIFLDHRFSIPNYPSRLLSYLSAGLPVVAATDKNTDIGEFLEENGVGVWCESSEIRLFHDALKRLENLQFSGSRVYQVLKENFDVADSYKIILSHINETDCK